MSRERELARPASREAVASNAAGGGEREIRPGKQSLVEAELDSGASWRAQATAPLPFEAQIQASFGRHDVSAVRVAVGGAAADAAARLGAEAFASGEAIAFRDTPDLRLAAHEAAHVVQQRSGLAHADASADHESHADSVAAAVVAGSSAESLLDRFGGAPVTTPRALQLKEVHVPTAAEEDYRVTVGSAWNVMNHANAESYFQLHDVAFKATFAAVIAGLQWPLPAPLAWRVSTAAIASAVVQQISAYASDVRSLFVHVDAWEVIDSQRAMDAPDSKNGEMWWRPAPAIRLAGAFVTELRDSFARMAPRRIHAGPHPERRGFHGVRLLRSSPLDAVVEEVLCDEKLVAIPADTPVVSEAALRPVKWEWVADADAPLWNWIRPDLVDATPEEIAFAVFSDTERAVDFEHAGGLYGMPVADAGVKRDHHRVSISTHDVGLELLATSLADTESIAEVAKPDPCPDVTAIVESLESSIAFAKQIAHYLVGWFFLEPLASLLLHLEAKRTWVTSAIATDLDRLGPAWATQRTILSGAWDLLEAASELFAQLKTAPTMKPAQPIVEFLESVQTTANASFLPTTGMRKLASSTTSLQRLPSAITELALRQARDVLHHEGDSPDDAAKADQANLDYTIQQLNRETGNLPSDEEQAALQLRIEEVTVLADVQNWHSQLTNRLADISRGLCSPGSLLGDSRLRESYVVVRDALLEVNTLLERIHANDDPIDDALPPSEPLMARLGHRKNVGASSRTTCEPSDAASSKLLEARLKYRRNELARIISVHHLNSIDFDNATTNAIETVSRNSRLVEMGAMLALTVATDGAAAWLGGAAAGLVTGAEVATTVGAAVDIPLAARVVAAGTRMIVGATGGAAVQTLIMGGNFSDALFDNLLSGLVASRVIKRFHGALEAFGASKEAIEGSWSLVGKSWTYVAVKGAALSGDLILTSAIQFASSYTRETLQGKIPDVPTMEELAMQGAAMAIGHVISAQCHAGFERLQRAGYRGGELAARYAVQANLALEVAGAKSADRSLELIGDHAALKQKEADLWKRLADDAEFLRESGITRLEIQDRLSVVEREISMTKSKAMRRVPFVLAGLSVEDAAGDMFAGTADQIVTAVQLSRKAGLEVSLDKKEGREWHIKAGDSEIVLRERMATNEGDQKIADAIMLRGHDGNELHSHFMGNVEPERFVAELEAAGGDGGSVEVSRWLPLLRKIAAIRLLNDDLDHTLTDGRVTERRASGDAVVLAKQTLAQIELLERRLAHASGPDAIKLRSQIDEMARSAVDKTLRASDETDFNSSYEIRDDLVKDFYGTEERRAVIGDHQSVTEARARLEEHFVGRPTVLSRIAGAVELEAIGNPNEGQRRQLANLRKLIDKQFGYDRYAEDTFVALARDHVTYTEQSNSLKKMTERFDPEQFEWVKKKAIADHPDLKTDLEALDVKHLAMIGTNNFGERGAPDTRDLTDRALKRPTDQEFDKAVRDVVALCARDDTAGIDIAGPEFYRFDEIGQKRLAKFMLALGEKGADLKKHVVFRPHVGEGANDTVNGELFARDHSRQMSKDGRELSHYERARNNIEVVLNAIESARAANPEAMDWVEFRFGHATHATPEQVVRMKRLGVIAEVNLTSNLQTGSIAQNKPAAGERDVVGADPAPTFDSDQSQLDSDFEDHSFATLVFSDATIALSTDGHSVMTTDRAKEYARAKRIIDDVIDGRATVRITADQARAMNTEGGTAVIPDGIAGNATVEVSYAQMSNEAQQRFEMAYASLYWDSGPVDPLP